MEKILDQIWQILFAIGQIIIVVPGQIIRHIILDSAEQVYRRRRRVNMKRNEKEKKRYNVESSGERENDRLGNGVSVPFEGIVAVVVTDLTTT